MNMNAYRTRLKSELFAAIDASGDLRAPEKRKLKRALRWRPFVRRAAMDMITEAAVAEGFIVITGQGDVEANIDWGALIEWLVEFGIPLLIELIGLFG